MFSTPNVSTRAISLSIPSKLFSAASAFFLALSKARSASVFLGFAVGVFAAALLSDPSSVFAAAFLAASFAVPVIVSICFFTASLITLAKSSMFSSSDRSFSFVRLATLLLMVLPLSESLLNTSIRSFNAAIILSLALLEPLAVAFIASSFCKTTSMSESAVTICPREDSVTSLNFCVASAIPESVVLLVSAFAASSLAFFAASILSALSGVAAYSSATLSRYFLILLIAAVALRLSNSPIAVIDSFALVATFS